MHLLIKNSIADCSINEKSFLQEASLVNFYQSASWISLLMETCFDEKGQLMLCFFYEKSDKEPVACLPMRDQKKKIYGFLPERCLMTLSQFYTCEYSLIVGKPECDIRSVVLTFLDYFATSDFNCLAFDSCFDQSFIKMLEDEGQKRGFFSEVYPHFIQRYQNFDGCKKLSIEALPSKLVHTLTRKMKKVTNDFEVRVDFYQGKTVEEGLLAYQAVYQKAWQKSEPHPEFIPRFVKAANEDGRLLISVLRLNQQPVAAQLWLEWKPGVFAIYKLAYDQAFQSYSPGSLLLQQSFDYLLAHKEVTEIDFGRGDDLYKRDWLPKARTAYGLELRKPSLMWHSLLWLKKWYRRLKGHG